MQIKRVFMGGPLDGISKIENVELITDTIAVPQLHPIYRTRGHNLEDTYYVSTHVENFTYERVDFGDDPLEVDEENHRLPAVLYVDPALPLGEIIRRLLNSFELIGGLTASFGLFSQPYQWSQPYPVSFRYNESGRWIEATRSGISD